MASESKLRDELEKQLTKELKHVSVDVDPETNKHYTITAKSKVWDRVLKLEAIKAKLEGDGWGSGFGESADK
jgi:predicted house-cleaning NTP pyrophosphatase (Maf/HAM1 superfamily)